MRTTDFDYSLPAERIAQTPVEPRHAARLMVLDRSSGRITHENFWELDRFLNPGDLLVLNETRVIPARLYGRKLPGGGRVEILLLRREGESTWETLVGGKGLVSGRRLQIDHGPQAEILAILNGASRLVRFDEPIEPYLPLAGHVPLPPYIHETLADPERYQTVYARQPGSAAAPTAGLHFTPELLEKLELAGIGRACLTLHVGLDTFAPVTEENPQEHSIHSEWCQVSWEAAKAINQTRAAGGRILAVGTTSARTLETAARVAESGQVVGEFDGPTSVYILPGFRFRAVDALVTNFHLPKSTLLMMVSAFAGRERILQAYETAIQAGYRFYSFGDAMLIL
jgi:S-adenosylmethionine:tRNA ribosyltransferase-isomerase